MTSNIFATLSNLNKLNMCGIQNPRNAHDARATNNLRITSGGRFLVVTVIIGNPGSLCVTRDITQVNCREHIR